MDPLLEGALFVLLERAGGEMRFTQSEFANIAARHGDYRVIATSEPGDPEPTVVVRIVPIPGGSTLVS